MNNQANESNQEVQNRGEAGAHTTDQDFTGARRDAERNTTDQPGQGSKPAEGDSRAGQESELGHS